MRGCYTPCTQASLPEFKTALKSHTTEQRTGASEYLGLPRNTLSGLQTLAQSISGIAPTAGPALLIPAIFATAGNGAWLSYSFATVAVCLVALNVNGFASRSSSAGSLYAYATSVFPGPFGQLAAWGLLFAYIGTAAAVEGGFANYADILLRSQFGLALSPILLVAVAAVAATWVAYRDIEISASVMLWFEAISVTLITCVIVATLWRIGFKLDRSQFELKGATPSGIRLGLLLALFSFVGFESATALGEEARTPRRTIPRAVLLSAIFAGGFFIFCAYGEVLGFREAHEDLGRAGAPLHVLAHHAGLEFLGPVIDVGAALSFLACAISCITAAARIALLMAHRRLLPHAFSKIHPVNKTPGGAVVAIGFLSFWGPAFLYWRGASGIDVNGLMGSLATFGFIIAYFVVSMALPVYLRSRDELSPQVVVLSVSASIVLLAALVGSLYPLPPPPYSYLGIIFFLYLLGTLTWSVRLQRSSLLATKQG